MNAPEEHNTLDELDFALTAALRGDSDEQLTPTRAIPSAPSDLAQLVRQAMDDVLHVDELIEVQSVLQLATEADEDMMLGRALAQPDDLREHVSAAMEHASSTIGIFDGLPQPPVIFLAAAATGVASDTAHLIHGELKKIARLVNAHLLPEQLTETSDTTAQQHINNLVRADALIIVEPVAGVQFGVARAMASRIAIPSLVLTRETPNTDIAETVTTWLSTHRDAVTNYCHQRETWHQRCQALAAEIYDRAPTEHGTAFMHTIASTPVADLLRYTSPNDLADMLRAAALQSPRRHALLTGTSLSSLADAIAACEWSVTDACEAVARLHRATWATSHAYFRGPLPQSVEQWELVRHDRPERAEQHPEAPRHMQVPPEEALPEETVYDDGPRQWRGLIDGRDQDW